MTRQTHKWIFRARFRRNAFGWRSQTAILRVNEAVKEILKVARKDPVLGSEGAVLFLEKVSPALEQVDSSSGAIGSAVNRAIESLVPVIAGAQVDTERRKEWLERLWEAYQEDQMPYIELLGDHWGELCASKQVASHWADELLDITRLHLGPDRSIGGFFAGSINCLSALLKAERYEELFDLLESSGSKWWWYRKFGVRALAVMKHTDEALAYAEDSRGLNEPDGLISAECEKILLDAGRPDEAYRLYGLEASWAHTYLSWFRKVVKKYPDRNAEEILDDLVATTPGNEGKWFAAARHADLFEKAIELAKRSPCEPKTLTRASRTYTQDRPEFALEVGVLALRWLLDGCGYEVSPPDVWEAYRATMNAAAELDAIEENRVRIRQMLQTSDSRHSDIIRIIELALKQDELEVSPLLNRSPSLD